MTACHFLAAIVNRFSVLFQLALLLFQLGQMVLKLLQLALEPLDFTAHLVVLIRNVLPKLLHMLLLLRYALGRRGLNRCRCRAIGWGCGRRLIQGGGPLGCRSRSSAGCG